MHSGALLRRIVMRLSALLAIAGSFLSYIATATELTGDEETVWNLEEAYWQFVKAGDVDSYKKLWHEDFVGLSSCTMQPSICTTTVTAPRADQAFGGNSRTPG